MDETMQPDAAGTLRETLTAWAYVIAAISGTSGGCLIAAHHILRGRPIARMIIGAYMFIGAVFGVAGIAVMALFTDTNFDFNKLIIAGLIFGVVGSTALAGANLSARILFRRLGIEVDVTVKRTGRRERDEIFEATIPNKED